MNWSQVAEYCDYMIRNLDDSNQVDGYAKQGITVVRGEARIAGPGHVDVDARTLQTERIIVATGTDASIPPISGLQETGFWTNREATTFQRLPESIVILGGGPVGIEIGQSSRAFGTQVTLVEAADRLLSREDPLVGDCILNVLEEDGIDVHRDGRAERVEPRNGRRVVTLANGGSLRS